MDEQRVDPGFEALHKVLEDAGAYYEAQANRADGVVKAATYAMALLAAITLMVVAWLWQREQVRRFEQEALRRSEERFRSLAQNASDAVTVIDAKGTIIYQSPSVERVFGRRPEDLIGRDVFELVHPGDLEHARSKFAEVLNSPGVASRVEARVRHADGSWRHAEAISNNLLGDPNIGGIVINTRDVTERKEAEEELRESEARYRTLVEQIPAVVYRQGLGIGNEMTYVSPHVEEMLGYPARTFTRSDFWVDVVHPDDREHVLAEDTHSAETYEPFGMEYRMITKDSRTVWVRDEAAVVRDENGQPLFWQGILLDVTERKRAEERYTVLVNNMPAVAYVEDLAKGHTVYISPRVEDLVGYAPERFTDDTELWWDVIHPVDREGLRAKDERAI